MRNLRRLLPLFCGYGSHPSDVICYAPRRYARGVAEKQHALDFSRTFVDMVEEYGRGYEFGLATRHYLKHFPLRLPSMAPMGLGLLSKKRMNITPKRIKNIKQLKAI